jgi:hypothetical protein
MEEEQQTQVKEEAKRKVNGITVLRIIATLLFIAAIVIVVLIKANNPDYKVGWIILILGGTFCISIMLWFLFNIKDWMTRKTGDEENRLLLKLPEPLDEATWQARIMEILKNPVYANEVTGYHKHRIISVGQEVKESILVVKPQTLYDLSDDYWIVLNLNYPNRFSVLINPTRPELLDTINSASSHPEDKPNVEISETTNPFTQTYQKTRKEIRRERAQQYKQLGDFK